MARGIEGNEVSTPRPPTLKKSSSSSQPEKSQKTLLGFFQKKGSRSSPTASETSDGHSKAAAASKKPKTNKIGVPTGPSASLTPAPSSDGPEASSPEATLLPRANEGMTEDRENGLPSPITPADAKADVLPSKGNIGSSYYSPSRKVPHKGKIVTGELDINFFAGKENNQLCRVWQ